MQMHCFAFLSDIAHLSFEFTALRKQGQSSRAINYLCRTLLGFELSFLYLNPIKYVTY